MRSCLERHVNPEEETAAGTVVVEGWTQSFQGSSWGSVGRLVRRTCKKHHSPGALSTEDPAD